MLPEAPTSDRMNAITANRTCPREMKNIEAVAATPSSMNPIRKRFFAAR
jgi:hypothetical protein